MTVQELIDALAEHGITATPDAIRKQVGKTANLTIEDVPLIVETWNATPSKGGNLAKASSGLAKAKPQPVAPAAASAAAPAETRIDAAAYQNDLAHEIAQPLIDAHRRVTALEDGLDAAAQHLANRKQQAFDNFYEKVATPAQTQELSHFFSQIPEEFKIFFPSVSGS